MREFIVKQWLQYIIVKKLTIGIRYSKDTSTDSPGFGNLKMTISFIHNFLTICPIRLRFSVLLDHNSVYIVPKWELSACVTFYSAPVFPKQSHGFATVDAARCFYLTVVKCQVFNNLPYILLSQTHWHSIVLRSHAVVMHSYI